MMETGRFRRMRDLVDSWARVALIFTVIVLNGTFEETQILAAEFMMFVRWTRDVLRYDLRWIIQEKFRWITSGRDRSTKD